MNAVDVKTLEVTFDKELTTEEKADATFAFKFGANAILSGTSLIFKKKNYIIEQRHCEFAKLKGSNFKGSVQKQINN